MEVFTLIGRIGLEGAGEVEDNLKNIEDGADNTSSKFENLMDKTDKLGRGMTKFVTGPIAAVAAGIAGLAYQAGQYADGILDTSSATGLATDTIQEYQAVAEVAGVNTQVLVRAQEMLTRQMARSEGGSARLTRAVENLSISYEELEDTSPEQRVMLLAEELGKIPDAAQRAETGMMLFGGAWRDLAPIVDLGTENIEKFRQRAQEVGYVMSNEGLNSANDYRVELVLLRQQFTGMWRDLQQRVIPILNNKLLPVIRNDLVPAFESLSNFVLNAVTWFAELNPETQKTLTIFTGIAAAMGPILIVLPQIVTSFQMLGSLLTPQGLVITGLVAIVGLLAEAKRQNKEFVESINDMTEAQAQSELQTISSTLAQRKDELETRMELINQTYDGLEDPDLPQYEKNYIKTLENQISNLERREQRIKDRIKTVQKEEEEQAAKRENVVEEILNSINENETELTANIKQELQSREDRFSDYQFKLAQLSREGWEAREAELKRQQERELEITEETFERNKEIMRENISTALGEDLDDDTLSQLQDEIVQVMEGGETEWDMPTGIAPELWNTINEEFFEPAVAEYKSYDETRRTIEKYFNEFIEDQHEQYLEQQEQRNKQEIAAEKRKEDEIMQNRFKANDISEQEYRRYLRQRLDDFEEFSNEWERRRSQIDMTLEAESDPNEFSRNLARLGRMGRQAASGETGGETEEQEISGFLQGIQQAHKQTTENINQFWQQTGQLLYNETQSLFAKTLKDAENFKDHFDNFMKTMADNALNQLARIAANKLFTTLLPGIPLAEGGKVSGGVSLFASGGMVTGAVNAVIGEGRDDEVVMPLNQGIFSELASSITNEMNNQGGTENGPTNINLYQIDGANETAVVNGVSRNPEVVKKIVIDSVKNNSEVRELMKRFI